MQQLAVSDDATRQELLSKVAPPSAQIDGSQAQNPSLEAHWGGQDRGLQSDTGKLILAKTREGRMCKRQVRKATQFYGGSSLFQMQLSENALSSRTHPDLSFDGSASGYSSTDATENGPHAKTPSAELTSTSPFGSKGETCRALVAIFFKNVYQYYMCIYREYFLRDYDAQGGGPYYSDMLLFTICAVAAQISPDPSHQALSPGFVKRAETLLYDSLEFPDLTTLQSLLILGHLSIGHGRTSKGWLFCGMAFRLTHEMGLHLDPSNWKSESESSVDREVLRRVYWAAFIADKQVSLYFGRPPALYPTEADVRNTIRIPYPECYQALLDTYVEKGTSVTAFEDGIALVGSFIHQAELAKVLHVMIVEVFENRLRQSSNATAAAAAAADQVHTSLAGRLLMLPKKLHWNQWTVGQVPSYVLHLHMLFNTAMIILHRPPRQHLNDEGVSKGEGVEVCYQSLSAIIRLFRSYTRYYRIQTLPLDVVHTLSAAAEVVLLKKRMEASTWGDSDLAKPLTYILELMQEVEAVWPCMGDVRRSIVNAMESEPSESCPQILEGGLGLMDGFNFDAAGSLSHMLGSDVSWDENVDLGLLVTDDYLNTNFSWDDAM